MGTVLKPHDIVKARPFNWAQSCQVNRNQGMVLMDDYLRELQNKGLITEGRGPNGQKQSHEFLCKKPTDGTAAPSRAELAALSGGDWEEECHKSNELREVEANVSKPQQVVRFSNDYTINEMLETMFDLEGLDLHLSVGAPPAAPTARRIYAQAPPLTQEKAEKDAATDVKRR